MEVVRRSADKVALVAAIATWWFLLRSRTGVVDAVDTISYLVMVYSVWRTVRSLVHKSRLGEIAMRRREEVETEKDEHATAGPGTT